jgi:membrane-bound lytic murein transglycosylase B
VTGTRVGLVRTGQTGGVRTPSTLLALCLVGALAACSDPRQRVDVEVPRAADAPVVDGDPDRVWLRDSARRTGIPARVLSAYARAADRVASDGCELGWNTLAGIGRVETSHARFGGASVDDAGDVRPRILGPRLDGGPGIRAIEDTDGGELDGDTTWDRAVGPMQFIPTTWERWGADADGDGRRDPHSIDDATLAAARYLCDAGDDLRDEAGWVDAVLTYNNSGDYVRKVADAAAEYAG